jgi:hypothetical protein
VPRFKWKAAIFADFPVERAPSSMTAALIILSVIQQQGALHACAEPSGISFTLPALYTAPLIA